MNGQDLLNAVWYDRHPLGILLLPLSWLFCLLTVLRRVFYAVGLMGGADIPVPVIVVGNITVGGTGKTPLVMWLIRFLRDNGYNPGVVTRGYGGRETSWPQPVHPDGDPLMVGDEPVLLARRCGCPVVAAPARVAAALMLVERHGCDIIVADDGLQHLALNRDVEIAVIDGDRLFGNGRCLPAGPLREPSSRLSSVDLMVVSGGEHPNAFKMTYTGEKLHNLVDETVQKDVEVFSAAPVHAVAGIGHPARFFARLRSLGFRVIEHAFPDHHVFTANELDFNDNLPVTMTEKDAVKCRSLDLNRREQYWYLPITADLQPPFGNSLLATLKRKQYVQETA